MKKSRYIRNLLIICNLFMLMLFYLSWNTTNNNDVIDKIDDISRTIDLNDDKPEIKLHVRKPAVTRRKNIITKVKVWPRGGDDLSFNQPWKIQRLSVVMNITQLDLNKRYITTNFTYSPGMGNLMFQFASLRGLAEDTNATLLIPANNLLRRAFGYFDDRTIFISNKVLNKLILKSEEQGRIHDLANCCKYYPYITSKLFQDPNLSNNNINLEVINGYFQSYKYFHPKHERLIRNYFTFLPKIVEKAETILTEAKDAKINFELNINVSKLDNDQMLILPDGFDNEYYYVGVHIRHGMDLTLHSRNQKHGHVAAPLSFIKKSMEHYLKKYSYRKIIFIVASDDNSWVKKNIQSEVKGQIVYLDNKYREIDIAVLSLCNATVLSTGTYSWWASYLSIGPTVFYDEWPRKDSDLDLMVNKTDYFLSNWITV